jgi:hypothetical protein
MKRGAPPQIALCAGSVFVTILNGAWILPQQYVGGYGPIFPAGNALDVVTSIIFLLSAFACYVYVALSATRYIEGVVSICVVACAALALYFGWMRVFHDPSLVYKVVWVVAGQLSPLIIILNIFVVGFSILFWRHRIEIPRGGKGGAPTES